MARKTDDVDDLLARTEAALAEIRALPKGQRIKLTEGLSEDELMRIRDALLWTRRSFTPERVDPLDPVDPPDPLEENDRAEGIVGTGSNRTS